jgi:hypothetical protein
MNAPALPGAIPAKVTLATNRLWFSKTQFNCAGIKPLYL